MPCDVCNPNVTDYGWEMSDVRATYYNKGPCEVCANPQGAMAKLALADGCENCDSTKVVTIERIIIRIRREFFGCQDCGEGSDYRCVYDVKVDGECECTFDDESKARRYIETAYPKAEPPEPDLDWESERWLRRAEGWGY